MSGITRKKGSGIVIIFFTLVLISQVIPGTCAAVPDDTPWIIPFITYPDLSVTNGSLSNHTLPADYLATPTLLKVQVELPETALPAPKGEMAVGPRAIGFSTDPVSLAIAILAILVAAAGVFWYLNRKPDEENRE